MTDGIGRDFSTMGMAALRSEAAMRNVDLSACVEKAEIIRKLMGACEASEGAPSETVGFWNSPQMKGLLSKEAVQSRSSKPRQRYFVLMGNFLMYYENAKESVFKPKGMWCDHIPFGLK